jgi:hypothetical protein
VTSQYPNKITGAVLTIELISQHALPSRSAGACGTRHAENNGAVGHARKGSRLNCRRANFSQTDRPEYLTKAINGLIE